MPIKKLSDSQGERPKRYKDRWRARLDLGIGEDGKRIRKAVYGKTAAEVRAKIAALKIERDKGIELSNSSDLRTVAQNWLDSVSPNVRPSTKLNYETELHYIYKHLHAPQIDKVSPSDVESMKQSIYKAVSPRASYKAMQRLRNVFDYAERMNLISRNVARTVPLPRYSAKPGSTWSQDETKRFLEASHDYWYESMFYIGLSTGMRVGELFALHRNNYDGRSIEVIRSVGRVSATKLQINEHTKTHYSRRVLVLSEAAQARMAIQLEKSDSELVFPSTAGTLASYSNVRRSLKTICTKANVPHLRVHDLRHTFASLYIKAMCERNEFDLFEFSRKIMGHSDPAFTLSKYGHIIDRFQKSRLYDLDTLL